MAVSAPIGVSGLSQTDTAWDDPYGLVALLRGRLRLEHFVDHQLGALWAHDRRRGTNLTAVLYTLLTTPGTKADIARRLFISRPVLYERIARIEEILGVALDDPGVRTSLYLAFVAEQVDDLEPLASIPPARAIRED